MNFEDNEKEAAFRSEATAWLESSRPSDAELEGLEPIARAQLWQKRKFDNGWACLSWPQELGGRGASTIEEVIFKQEEQHYVPSEFVRVFTVGQGMIAPTLMAWASEEHKSKLLPKLASGEEIWCQMFSEPAAGSDLAALQMRAVRDGDSWVLNGQKIWTSWAESASWGVVVARSDQNVPKHKGLCYFFLDMSSDGVEVRPIRQISGSAEFNEVYFNNVRVPDDQRLGDVGQGWTVALTTLMNERASLLTQANKLKVSDIRRLAERTTIAGRPAIEDSATRKQIANWLTRESGLKYTAFRSLSALSRGETPGPENSIGKLVSASDLQDMAAYALDLMEQRGIVRNEKADSEFGTLFQDAFMVSPGRRVAGGTDEVLANIIAERVLGLPQEPRSDKNIPFKDVPTGG